MKSKRNLMVIVGVALAAVLSVVLSSVAFAAPPKMYVASVELAAQDSPQFHTKYPKSSSRWLQQGPQNVGSVLTSEKVLQSAARYLTLYNITVDPEALLSAVKVEPVQGSRSVRLTITSENRKEALSAVNAVVANAQWVYVEMNGRRGQKGGKDDVILEITKPVAVRLASAGPPLQDSLVRQLLFALAWLLAAVLVVLAGITAGRAAKGGSKRGRAVGGLVITLTMVALVGSITYLVRTYTSPQLYIGRTRLVQRLSSQAELQPNAEANLDKWLGTALNGSVMSNAAKTLRLFKVSKAPEGVLGSAKIERLPGTEVFKVEVTSTRREEAEAAADCLGAEMSRLYSATHNPSAVGTAGNDRSKLLFAEEAHVYPVRRGEFAYLSGCVIAASFVLLVAAVGGFCTGRRDDEHA
jgi:capsular polysaccharide biosynthesis protein